MTEQKIAVYGASGFTGRLVVAELARREIPTVLIGRDIERLRSAAEGAGLPDAELRVATLDSPALADSLRGSAAVINTAGPFARWGAPVIRAAIDAGVHYIDTAGEQGFLKQVFDNFAASAEHAGVTVVPGLADDGGPGDLIGHLVAERVAPAEQLTIADLRSAAEATRGTARSMLGVSVSDRLTYQDGQWEPAEPSNHLSVAVPDQAEPIAAVEFALPGVITLPRHTSARRVNSALRTEIAEAFAGITPELVDGMPEGPAEEARRAARWLMVASAVGSDGRGATGVVSGTDSYGTTAVIAVEGARRLIADGAKPGVLAPSQAFDPEDFLDFLAPFGVSWSIEN